MSNVNQIEKSHKQKHNNTHIIVSFSSSQCSLGMHAFKR